MSDDEDLSKWGKIKKKVTPSPANFAKMSYLGILLLGFIAMVFLRDHFFGVLSEIEFCPNSFPSFGLPTWIIEAYGFVNASALCINPYVDYIAPWWFNTFGVTLTGFSSVHRIGFSMGIFFLLNFLFSLIGCIPVLKVKAFAIFINNNAIAVGIKYVLWILLTLCLFFVNDIMFIVTAWISLFLSALFLLIQVILLMELAWSWQEKWTELDTKEREEHDMDEEGGFSCAMIGYIGMTVLIYVITLILCIFMFVVFSWGGCWYLIVTMAIYTVIFLVLIGFSFIPFFRIGLLPPAIIVMYGVYMLYSAMLSFPLPSCNIFSAFSNSTQFSEGLVDENLQTNLNNVGQIFSIVLTIIISVISTIYSAVSSSSKIRKAFTIKCGDSEDDDVDDEEDKKLKDDAVGICWTHFVFALCSFFFATILTNWEIAESNSVIQIGSEVSYNINVSFTSFGVKLAMIAISLILFIWICFKRRFIDEQDEDDD